MFRKINNNCILKLEFCLIVYLWGLLFSTLEIKQNSSVTLRCKSFPFFPMVMATLKDVWFYSWFWITSVFLLQLSFSFLILQGSCFLFAMSRVVMVSLLFRDTVTNHTLSACSLHITSVFRIPELMSRAIFFFSILSQ